MNETFVSLDIESTGLDPVKDRIVQFAAVFYSGWPSPATLESEINWLFDPGFPMTPEVIAIHGITNERIAGCPSFDTAAQAVIDAIAGRVIIGFNLFGLDLPILWEEFHRCGIKWDWRAHQFIDVGTLFKIREPRTLSAAVRFYCNRDHAEAHDALADAAETAAVFTAQIRRYTDLQSMTIPSIATATRHPERTEIVDLAGKFGRNSKGQIVYCFGKSRGVPVLDDPGIARWMLGKDFPMESQQCAVAILEGRLK